MKAYICIYGTMKEIPFYKWKRKANKFLSNGDSISVYRKSNSIIIVVSN